MAQVNTFPKPVIRETIRNHETTDRSPRLNRRRRLRRLFLLRWLRPDFRVTNRRVITGYLSNLKTGFRARRETSISTITQLKCRNSGTLEPRLAFIRMDIMLLGEHSSKLIPMPPSRRR